MASPYEVLGVEPDADDGEVVDAYRERVKEVHPDHGGTPAEFRAVKTAYERIKAGYEPPSEADPGPPDRTAESEASAQPAASDVSPDGPEEDDEDDDRLTVEYLNYDILRERGWDLADADLFAKAADADLDPVDYGVFAADHDESLLEAAEDAGFAWPFACRGGACTNCAIAVVGGEVASPQSHILPPDLVERGIRLSCIVTPVTDDMQVVYNLRQMPAVSDLLLPASRYDGAVTTD